MRTWFATPGTRLDPTIPHSPQENSIIERLTRTLMDCVRATLAVSGLSFDEYWALCLLDTVVKTNTVLHTPSNTVPLLEWNRHRHDRSAVPLRSPDLNQFRMFGETAYVPVREEIMHKSHPRGRFVRYLFTDISGRYQTIDINTGLFQMVRPQDYRSYNPKFDPRRLYQQHVREQVLLRVNQHYAFPTEACSATVPPVAHTHSMRAEPQYQDPAVQDHIPQNTTQDPQHPRPLTSTVNETQDGEEQSTMPQTHATQDSKNQAAVPQDPEAQSTRTQATQDPVTQDAVPQPAPDQTPTPARRRTGGWSRRRHLASAAAV